MNDLMLVLCVGFFSGCAFGFMLGYLRGRFRGILDEEEGKERF